MSSTDQPALDFATWLTEHKMGTANTEMTDAIAEVIQAVTSTGKNGTVTLTVKLAPMDGGALGVSARVDAKAPRFEPMVGIYFAHPDGSLRRNPWEQPVLPFDQTDDAGTPASVDPETGEITR